MIAQFNLYPHTENLYLFKICITFRYIQPLDTFRVQYIPQDVVNLMQRYTENPDDITPA